MNKHYNKILFFLHNPIDAYKVDPEFTPKPVIEVYSYHEAPPEEKIDKVATKINFTTEASADSLGKISQILSALHWCFNQD